MYRGSRGVAKNDGEAFRWFRKAAEQGNAVGENNLGAMYETGRGVGKDDGAAASLYRKAAEQGNAAAQTNLGYMYETGRGVAKDDAAAAQWYRKAAEQDFVAARVRLGNTKRIKGDLDGAIADYTRAIQLDPKLAGACRHRRDAQEGQS